jgi:putative metallohydrolase (TIGR04338 family)
VAKRYKADDVFPLPKLKMAQEGTLVAGIGRPAPVIRYQESPRTNAIIAAELEVRRIMRNPLELAPNGHLFPVELRWSKVEQVQGYVDIVLSWPWDHWRTGPAWPVKVEWDDWPNPHYESGIIHLPKAAPWTLRELIVLHELAHHFTQGQLHELAWVRAFLDLTSTCMDPIVGQLLRTHFNQQGIATG